MKKDSRLVFFFGFLLLFSCFFFGTIVLSYAATYFDTNNRGTSINELSSEETSLNSEKVYSRESSNGIIEPLIDQLIEKIQVSADECWRDPVNNRKDAMINKLNALKNFLSENNLGDLYDKLLHDIKPKLTGLKTDENEDPWGNGVFNNPWVICPDLQEEFRILCNEILNPQQPH
ncbi:MAG: hypothetical protein ACFFDH_17145 [Promethearchaeota archaeon]